MMHGLKVLAVAAALFAGGVVASQATEWKALSANAHGWGYATAFDENVAKMSAIDQCQKASGRTCAWETATSVPSEGWVLVMVDCPVGRSTGGSRQNLYNAQVMAAQKVGMPAAACSLSLLK